MKILLVIFASVTGLGVLTEIGLRTIMGLGNPPLYIADPEIGYLLAPNQKIHHRSSSYQTNQYSMRSQPLQTTVSKRILLLGDSVVNGSWWTDQSATLSSLLSNQLLANNQDDVEVLNIAANSWGPRNQLAYVERFGLFEGSTLVLIINTDDLFALQPTSAVVGKYPNYPDKAPLLALIEYYQLFIAPPRSFPELNQLAKATTESDRLKQNLAAIKKIKAIADTANMEFILVLTPLLREFQSGSTELEQQARSSLQELITTENIEYLDVLTAWQDFPQPEFLYRDRIHPTPQGNIKLVEAIAEKLAN